VPGEWYSPTQPFPTKTPAYDRQGVSLDDLIDFTPELKAEAVKIASRYKIGPIFTPPVVSTWPSPLATLMLPSAGGGVNWHGGSFDPETKMLYVYSTTTPTPLGLLKNEGTRSDFAYLSGTARDPNAPAPVGRGRAGAPAGPPAGGEAGTPGIATAGPVNQAPPAAEGGGGALTVQGLPLIKPPYGRITAFDMNKGDLVWQIAHGETPDNIKNHPALKGITIPRTGRTGRIGTLVTRTLLVAGEGGFFTTPNGQRGAMLRAYDKATGNEVASVYMPAPQSGTPMTYMLNGKQYIVLATSGGSSTGELLAFRLP
jgi:quinoprotein glucose dehydrogenase